MNDIPSNPPTDNAGDGPYPRSQAEDLVGYLARAVAAFEARMRSLVAPPSAPPDQPYKSLYAFEIEDSDIFFGRAVATRALYRTLLTDRLAVLHARSGAGKTSLLNAGLSPRLISEGRLPVYARTYDDPVGAIKRVIAPPAIGPWPDLLLKLSLHQFLTLVCEQLSPETRELVIILDQFEEFFLFWPERSRRQLFIDNLAECYNDAALPVRVVIAIRREYFSDLCEFQDRIPTILSNECWLGPMTRDQVHAAIVGPVAELSSPVTYEPALLEELFDDLLCSGPVLSLTRSEGVASHSDEPASQALFLDTAEGSVLNSAEGTPLLRLQLICAQLYQALAEDDASAGDEASVTAEAPARAGRTITLASYEKLGRIAGMPGSYLQSVMERLPEHERSVAREALKELITATLTRRILSGASLAERIEVERVRLGDVLDRLVGSWILRRQAGAGEDLYELAHECLVREIQPWIDPDELALKQVQYFLKQDVADWQVRGTLVSRERLEQYYPYREEFKGLEPEARECLVRSSLTTGFAVEDWARLAGEVGERLLLTAINDRSERVRRAVTRALGAIWGLPEVCKLGEEDQDVRRAAAEALGEIRDHRAVGPLITALADDDSGVREAAAWALGQFGGLRALGPLIAALGDDDDAVRQAAAAALGELGDRRAAEPLVIALGDQNPSVRRAAARELGKLGNPRAVGPLIVLLQDEHRGVRRAASAALVELGEPAVGPLIASLEDEDWDVRWGAVWALGEVGHPRAVEPLVAALQDAHDDVRQAAAGALAKLGEPAVEPLVVALTDEDPKVRRRAAEALGALAHPRAVDPLIAALGDGHSGVQEAASGALVRLGEVAVEPLIVALGDENRQVRRAGARVLAEIRDPRVVSPLIEAMQDDDDHVRRAAAAALKKIGDHRAVEPFITALNDGDRYVRREVAWGLGALGDPRAVEPLIVALQDEDRGVRQAAASALVKLGAPAVEPLEAALGNPDPDARWAVINILGEIGDPRATEPLIGILQDEDGVFRRAAAASLGKIGDELALRPLIGLLQDHDSSVRWAATGALGQLGDPRAIQPLLAVLKDEDNSVRRGATDALKKIGPPRAPDAPERVDTE